MEEKDKETLLDEDYVKRLVAEVKHTERRLQRYEDDYKYRIGFLRDKLTHLKEVIAIFEVEGTSDRDGASDRNMR